MEIINIEKKTYEDFVGKFEHFVKKMTEIGNRGTDKRLGEWLDNDDVCRILRISQRTLQTLRDNGTLPYIKLGGKVLYRESDLEELLQRCYHPVIRRAV